MFFGYTILITILEIGILQMLLAFMFSDATKFNKDYIINWDVSKVIDKY